MSAARAATPACLFGAGVLGHTWVGTRVDADGERILIQASYGADAVRALDEDLPPEQRGSIYERVSRKRWVRRSRAAALLDQPRDGRKPYEPAIADDVDEHGGAS